MKVPREEIYQALFDKLDALRPVSLTTTSRKLKHIEECDPASFPCGYQVQQDEAVRSGGNALPAIYTFNAEWWLYVQSSSDIALSTLLNPLLDKACDLLDPETPLTLQTLSGRVYNAKVEGSIEIVEGVLGDRALAIVPIKITKVP